MESALATVQRKYEQEIDVRTDRSQSGDLTFRRWLVVTKSPTTGEITSRRYKDEFELKGHAEDQIESVTLTASLPDGKTGGQQSAQPNAMVVDQFREHENNAVKKSKPPYISLIWQQRQP